MIPRTIGRAALACAALLGSTAAALAEVTDFTLDNGMEVVVIENHRAPAVVHMLWYKAGSADEVPGRSGVAHYLEHLLFKATDTLAAGEFSETVAANGGTDNAFTSFDYTAYFQRVAADRLDLMMSMEADRMRNLRIAQEDILVERDVVIEERAQRTDSDPGSLFAEQRSAAQYLNHPYGRPVIGWRAEMEGMSLEDVLAFYERFYAPNNAVLVVAGDVTPDEVRAMAQAHYGPIPANPEIGARVRPQEPPQIAPRRMVFEDARIGQPYVIRTYLAPERDAGDQREAAALTLLAEVLGGSPTTSVLGRALQFETGEAVWTSAFYDGVNYDDTTFGLVVVPQEGVALADAEAALDREVAAFLDAGVDPAQLDRIKFQIRAAQVYADDDAGALARRYGAALTSGLTVADVAEWPDLLDSITPEEVVAAGRRVFDLNASVTGWLKKPDLAEAAADADADADADAATAPASTPAPTGDIPPEGAPSPEEDA